MKIFLLCILGEALFLLGFNFGYVRGYGQGKEDEMSEWSEKQMQAVMKRYIERNK